MTLLAPPPDTSTRLADGIVAVLFAADGPLDIDALATALEVNRRALERGLAELHEAPPAGLMVQRHEDRLQLVTAPAWSRSVTRLRAGPPVKLSRAALEVLAIVAYRQPVTRAEIDQLRGVNSDRSVAALLAYGLIEEVGRRETVGRPSLFATTVQFLELIGSASLSDLPSYEELAAAESPDPGEETPLDSRKGEFAFE